MNTHKNAPLTPEGRERMVRAVVDDGKSMAAAARAFRTSAKTVGKWVGRFREHGVKGLRDRSSRPHSLPSQTPLATCDEVERLRRERYTQDQIAAQTGLSRTTVSRILNSRGLSHLACLEPKEPRPRYERETPGEIIHIDIKKLGRFSRPGHRVTGDRHGQSATRGVGWEYVHVAIDDHSRVAYCDIFPNEKEGKCARTSRGHGGLLQTTWCHRHPRDDGQWFLLSFEGLSPRMRQTQHQAHPHKTLYTPQTNGKAERFIQTTIREWAYATEYHSSEQRQADLPQWLHRYNWHRPHASLNKKPPISRLGLTENNLLKLHN